MRIGIVGAGSEAEQHVQAWRSVAAVTIVRATSSYSQELRSMLDGEPLSAVSLCSPSPTRRLLAADCLEAGLPVLSELPLSGDVDSARTLLESASRKPNARLVPANRFRFSSDMQMARGIIGGGSLGDMQSFRMNLTPPFAVGERTGYQPLSGPGILFDLGWQAVDLASYMFGIPHTIEAARVRPGTPTASDAVALRLEYAGGLTGEVRLCPSQFHAEPNLLLATGSDGRIEVGWNQSFFRPQQGEVSRLGDGFSFPEAYNRMMSLFTGVVQGFIPPWTTIAECREILGVIVAAQVALATDRPVPVVPTYRRPMAA
ncbi:MAG: Gfo/Idh/MocA family oxidoreductase [Bryobacteraceae bacterium]